MSHALITGANRGLGLEFVKQYLHDGWTVDACCRNPNDAGDLQQLAETFSTLKIHSLDVGDEGSVASLTKALGDITLDLLINNAGIYLGRHDAFGDLSYSDWARSFEINTMGPMRVAEAVIDNLRKGNNPKIINISSLMGSIDDNKRGGSYLYRTSKAALNAATRSLAVDLKGEGIKVAVLHPGWVKTDMGGESARLEIPESVQGMRQVIEELTEEETGSFIQYNGQHLNW